VTVVILQSKRSAARPGSSILQAVSASMRRRLRVSVAGLNDGSVLVREAAPRVPARPQQRPGRGMPEAVRAVLEDNIGELVEVQNADNLFFV